MFFPVFSKHGVFSLCFCLGVFLWCFSNGFSPSVNCLVFSDVFVLAFLFSWLLFFCFGLFALVFLLWCFCGWVFLFCFCSAVVCSGVFFSGGFALGVFAAVFFLCFGFWCFCSTVLFCCLFSGFFVLLFFCSGAFVLVFFFEFLVRLLLRLWYCSGAGALLLFFGVCAPVFLLWCFYFVFFPLVFFLASFKLFALAFWF